MRNLKVDHWHQWEQLCCHFMQRLANEEFGVDVRYVSYGSRGQSQFGIDLVPSYSTLPVVGQCKLKERSFTWDDALEEVRKTDKYDNPIQFYTIFTTAPVHTTVQDVRNRGGHVHIRPDGTRFPVEVFYWAENQSLHDIPQAVLRDIFPGVFNVVEGSTSARARPTNEEQIKSVKALKEYVPRWIGSRDLAWLESWDFGIGYVREQDFAPFVDLFLEHDRAVSALKGIPEWLPQGDRALIAECLLAGRDFFFALSEFKRGISSHTIGQGSPGSGHLTLAGLDSDFVSKETTRWESLARELATVYRRDVIGERVVW